jgi:hypothetical protein
MHGKKIWHSYTLWLTVLPPPPTIKCGSRKFQKYYDVPTSHFVMLIWLFCKQFFSEEFCFVVQSFGIDSSGDLGMPLNEHFLLRNNWNRSETIPRNFLRTKFHSQPYPQPENNVWHLPGPPSWTLALRGLTSRVLFTSPLPCSGICTLEACWGACTWAITSTCA